MTEQEKTKILDNWNNSFSRWCDADRCRCMGCVNRDFGIDMITEIIGRKLTKEEHQELLIK
jgi:hypothetical protein